ANHSMAMDVIRKIGLAALTGGLPLFIPINNIALLMDIENQCSADPENIVFVIDKSVTPEQMYIDRINAVKSKGFRFGVQNITSVIQYESIIELCDFFLLSSKNDDTVKINKYINIRFKGTHVILKNIDTVSDYEAFKRVGFFMYEGLFYRMPVTKGNTEVTPLKANYIQLMNLTNDENFDIGEVADIVQQDTALAISLLHMVNSLNLSSKVKSIKNAAALLGQNELRKWIITAAVSQLCVDKPNEITRVSLIRAKFAEYIAPAFEMAISSKELFLMGLFSVIDIILDMPMDKALDTVMVNDIIRDALVNKKGKFSPVLEFIKTYESADWQQVSFMLILHNIPANVISEAYLNSLTWYSTLLTGLEGQQA
ncbi:HDOD domain-containing protein, partial [Tyzzerella sp. OttesenSCG-928-J15]|nr:HDOD domain-containing protein [Tyzzerella sp. OttesenSCG-928-J15]